MIRPTHVAAYIVHNTSILIQRRSADRPFLPSAWDVIGGAIDAGETEHDALRREVLEETSMQVTRIGPWITRVAFRQEGKDCLELGAFVAVKHFSPRLERGKASAFALVQSLEAIVDDNEARGYGNVLTESVGQALVILLKGADEVS